MSTHNPISAETLSIHGVNPHIAHDSSSRAVMLASHFAQKLVLNTPDEKIIQTGVDMRLSEYTLGVRFPCDAEIVEVIHRYKQTADGRCSDVVETIVIYFDLDTNELSFLSVPYYRSYHSYFGFKMEKNSENFSRLIPGQRFAKDEVLADTPAVGENGSYDYGKSLNVAYMSVPGVAEDGFDVSQDALDSMAFKVFDRRVIHFDSTSPPINIYGTEDDYRPLPEIGEIIRDDGVVAASKNIKLKKGKDGHPSQLMDVPVMLSVHDMSEIDSGSDTVTYVRGPGGKVVDLKVIDNTPLTSKRIWPGMTGQLDRLSRELTAFHQELIEFDVRNQRDVYRKFGKGNIASYSPKLHRLLVEAYAMGSKSTTMKIPDKFRKVKLTDKREVIKNYRVEMVIEYTMVPDDGFKLSDIHGGKGIMCRSIKKTEDMPVDQWGNRADIIMDGGSTVSRMNVGRLYEHFTGAMIVNTRREVCGMLGFGVGDPIEKVVAGLEATSDELINQTMDYLIGMFDTLVKTQADYFRDLTDMESRREYLAHVVSENLIMHYRIGELKEPAVAYRDVAKTKYNPEMGPVTYRDLGGKMVTTEEDIRIAPMYCMLLEKISDDGLSVASPRTQHHGLPVAMMKEEKKNHPQNGTPPKILGATEGQLFAGFCGPEATAESYDRASSLKSHRCLYTHALTVDKGINSKCIVDRDLIPLGSSRPLQLYRAISKCAGWKSVYEPETITQPQETLNDNKG